MPSRRQFIGQVGAAGGLLSTQLTASEAVAEASPAPHAVATKAPGALRVALMQALPAGNDQRANLQIAERYCREAAAKSADVLLMPEMWNIGYQNPQANDADTIKEWSSQAVASDGPWVGRFNRLAKELGMAIAVTYLEQWPGKPRNSLTLIDRFGESVLTYGKVHTCDFAFEAALTPGDGWPVAEVDTAIGTVSIGSMICFDREFPESARSLMLGGAELVLTPNGCLLDTLRISQFQVRAYENAMAVAMANYADGLHNGKSVVFDATSAPLLQAPGEQGLYYADINIEAQRHYRARTLWGDAWRRPDRYGTLTSEADLAVFQRQNVFGERFRS